MSDTVLVALELQTSLVEVAQPTLLTTEGLTALQVLEVLGTPVTQLLTLVEEAVTLLTVAEQGPAGSSSALPSVAFAFGDASPRAVYTPPAGALVIGVRLLIDTAFNGLGAALQLQAGARVLMPATLNDPLTVGEYESSPRADVPAGSAFVLTVTPGAGATQGAGRLIFQTLAG